MKKAFTIIELMIVIAIIGILLAVVVPRGKGMRDQSNTTKAKADIRMIQTAVESYNLHNGSYPATLSNLATATPSIIGDLPVDPFASGANYGYKVSPNGYYYIIYSVGMNGAAGITGISDTGNISGAPGDDIYVSNRAASQGI